MNHTFKITYHNNSGFSVHLGKILLIFDYWEGVNRDIPEYAKIVPEKIKLYDKVFIFVSNSHIDHIDSIIYDWQSLGNVRYITSEDVPLQPNTTEMKPGDAIKLTDDIDVFAYGSTDWGVSFYVRVGTYYIFHAGNLNLWHWREESTPAEIEYAQESFNNVLKTIHGLEMTVAFFPVDPRQGPYFDAGAIQFVLDVKPKLIIPMHWCGRTEVAQKFASEIRNPYTESIAMTTPGSIANIEYRDEHLFASLLAPKEIRMEDFQNEKAIEDADNAIITGNKADEVNSKDEDDSISSLKTKENIQTRDTVNVINMSKKVSDSENGFDSREIDTEDLDVKE